MFLLGGTLSLVPVYASAPLPCISISTNLYRGLSGNSVTTLQNFLSANGYFTVAPTGYFGPITFAAVQRYQASQGITTTGYVGVLTRAAIESACKVVPPTASTIRTLTPSAAPVGATVSITGFGFTNDNTILLDGNLVARNIPISSSIAVACTTDPTCVGGIRQTIMFTVPGSVGPNCPIGSMCPLYMRLITPGSYTISVQNSEGTSNSLPFTVVDSTGSQPLAITGLDAPTTLPMGTTGTWNIHVTTSNASSQLHYSVVWGDEVSTMGNTSIVAPGTQSVQNSATFTHAYQRTGTYTPVFRVTDDNGNSVSTSNTLSITPLY